MRSDRTTICRGKCPALALSIVLCATAARVATQVPVEKEKIDLAIHLVALDVRWTLTFETPPAAPAGFDERSAYVPLKSGEMMAVDLERGEVRWTVPLATTFSPATGDGLVFASGEGSILAYEDRTGTPVWRTPLPNQLARPLFWDTGWLIATLISGELVGAHADDGTIAWRTPLGAALAVGPAVAGDRLYVALADGRVLALDLAAGTELWTRSLGQSITGLVTLDDQLIVGTRGNRVYSLDLAKGKDRWIWKLGADVSGAAVADTDHVYFAAFDNILRALDRDSGNLQWLQRLPSRPVGGPLLTGDVVIVPTVSAAIGAYYAKTGKAAFTITATGEIGGPPFLRESPRPTAPRLVALSREGMLQGFAPRYEPPPAALPEMPGVKVTGDGDGVRCRMSGFRCQVSGIRRYQVLGIRF